MARLNWGFGSVARLNIETKWFDDPRRAHLIRLFAREPNLANYAADIADGVVLNLWRLAQSYMKDGRSVIPADIFDFIEAKPKLIEAKLVRAEADGYYVVGSAERLSWIELKRKSASKGGKSKSEKKTKNLKQYRSKTEASLRENEVSTEAKPKSHPHPLPTSSSSSSSSCSSEISEGVKNLPEAKTLGSRIWDAYEKAYLLRWKVIPRRNATTNAQCAHIGKRLGEDAIAIVEFFLQHNDGYYLKTHHALGGLLKDAEALHTQWLRGQAVTSQQVRQFEKQSGNLELLERVRRGEA